MQLSFWVLPLVDVQTWLPGVDVGEIDKSELILLLKVKEVKKIFTIWQIKIQKVAGNKKSRTRIEYTTYFFEIDPICCLSFCYKIKISEPLRINKTVCISQ